MVAANGSWTQAVPFDLRFGDSRPGSVHSVCLSDDDLDRHPLLRSEEAFRVPLEVTVSADTAAGTLPPHSVTFLRLRV